MKKMELLAPAGDFESLKMAVYYGADAVYLGISQFNARNNIKGFTLDNLGEAVKFAHTFGVKVYLTLNILFKDEEMQSALDVVCKANNVGVDAFIVQDLGLSYLIRKYYPTVELHASTQMGVHNLEGVRVLEGLGFKRVVLARETSLQEIERIHKNSNIEIEFFVQGALCVGFSGNCYMCSHLVDKSGNRGVCQQFCRLPYTFNSSLVEKQGFLLSAKDICMLDQIKQLQNAGVCSLKIEGRARRPFYVAEACKIYREVLDKGEYKQTQFDNLQIAFNREYTPAYFDGNGNIISKIQGNNGLYIGKVKEVKYGKKFNEVFITTDYDLRPNSGLKFTLNNKEIASIGAVDIKKVGKLYRVTTTAKILPNSKVYIISSEVLEKEVSNYVRKLDIKVQLTLIPDKPITIASQYGGCKVEVKGPVCEKAKTIQISREQLLKQLSRSEVFNIVDFEFENQGCYLLNSTINSLRNNLYAKLQEKIIKQYNKPQLEQIELFGLDELKKGCSKTFDFEIVEDIDKASYLKNVIYDYNNFELSKMYEFDTLCKTNKVKGFIDLPVFATESDINIIKKVLDNTNLGVVVNNLYGLNFDCNKMGGQFLNIYNSYTLKILNQIDKFEGFFIEELKDSEFKNIITDRVLLRREKVYMTLLHCPFKVNIGGDCSKCKYDQATYTLNTGKRFKIKRKKTVNCIFLLKD